MKIHWLGWEWFHQDIQEDLAHGRRELIELSRHDSLSFESFVTFIAGGEISGGLPLVAASEVFSEEEVICVT